MFQSVSDVILHWGHYFGFFYLSAYSFSPYSYFISNELIIHNHCGDGSIGLSTKKILWKKTHHFVCYFSLFSGHLSLKIHWKLNLCIVCEYLRTIYSVLKCSCRWTTDWTGEFCCCSYFLLVCRIQLKIKRNRNPLGVIFIQFLLLPWWRVKMIRTSS